MRHSNIPAIVAMVLIFWVVWLLAGCSPAAASIPPDAEKHRRTLVRTAHQQMGLDAPIATLAAQVHQESRWHAAAVSPAGAQGMAQFMPATANWMPDIAPALGQPQPFNPGWALRALVAFDVWLLARTPAATQCENWAFTLAAYNGGLGWVQREKRQALEKGFSERVYFESVETQNAGRAAASKSENTHYVRNILTRWEPLYANAGWGKGVCEERWKI